MALLVWPSRPAVWAQWPVGFTVFREQGEMVSVLSAPISAAYELSLPPGVQPATAAARLAAATTLLRFPPLQRIRNRPGPLPVGQLGPAMGFGYPCAVLLESALPVCFTRQRSWGLPFAGLIPTGRRTALSRHPGPRAVFPHPASDHRVGRPLCVSFRAFTSIPSVRTRGQAISLANPVRSCLGLDRFRGLYASTTRPLRRPLPVSSLWAAP
jgi:hypothetical protein